MNPRTAKALALLRSGKAPTYAAKCIGVNQARLSHMFSDAGLPNPRSIWFDSIVERVDPNLTISENARRLRVSNYVVKRAIKQKKESKQCSR